jgi:hypothetical protein
MKNIISICYINERKLILFNSYKVRFGDESKLIGAHSISSFGLSNIPNKKEQKKETTLGLKAKFL